MANRTYIELPSSGVIDLFDDIPLSFNYSIADVRSPEARDTTFSKTITIPGTKNNNKLFDHIFDVGKSGGFNPNVKAKAIVYVDTIPVFDGYLQLTDVTKTDKNEIQYDVVIFGKLANIYTVWADDELKNIDYSDLSHTYNSTNIINSWSASVGSGYVYPLIDMGRTDGTYYNVEDMFPSVYLKEYIDRIFKYAGYTYTSSFFNTDFFKRLIVPFNGTKLQLTAQEITDRKFKAVPSATQTITIPQASGGGLVDTAHFNTLTVTPNPSSQYDTGTYTWTVNKTGTYEMWWDIYYDYNVVNASGSSVTQRAFFTEVMVGLQYSTDGGITWNAFGYSNNDFYVGLSLGTTYPASSTTSIPSNPFHSYGMINKYLTAGMKIRIGVGGYRDTINANLSTNIVLKTTSSFYNVPVSDISCGDYLNFNDAIPDRIKIRDVFTSVIKAFNLYVEEDKNVANNLLIEPRNDFYGNGTTYDWTSKLAIDRPFEIKPMGVLDARDYLFTYKEDGDYWNERYKNEFNKIYGDRLISANNDFLVDTKKTELIFSPSPMVEIPIGSSSNRIVPQIVQADSQGNISAKTGNLRLLYWGGLIATNQSWILRGAGNDTTFTNTYPYAGHLDNPLNPTIDLNFGIPRQLFYIPNNYTNNNLFNVYYKKFIDEITDKDSKLVTGYFHLTPIDMLRLDFRNSIFVDGHYYRINKISDYNPTADELTKVELLKIKEGVSFIPTTGTVNTLEQTLGNETGYGYFPTKKSNGNTYNTQSQQLVLGSNNYVDARALNVLVTGKGNVVGANSTGVVVLNSSGCTVQPGLSNVTLMNTSGVTVTQSNQVYINGNLQQGSPSDSIKIIYGDYTITPSDEYILCGSSGTVIIGAKYPYKGTSVVIKNGCTIGSGLNVVIKDSLTYDRQIDYDNYLTIGPLECVTLYRFSESQFVNWSILSRY